MPLDDSVVEAFEAELKKVLDGTGVSLLEKEYYKEYDRWHFPTSNISFKGRPASLVGTISKKNGAPQYGVGPGFERRCHKEWLAVKGFWDSDANEVVSYFKQLLAYAKKGEMPADFKEVQMVWIGWRKPPPPVHYEELKIIMDTLGCYCFKDFRRHLEVSLCHNPEDDAKWVRITYDYNRYMEQVNVIGAQVTAHVSRSMPDSVILRIFQERMYDVQPWPSKEVAFPQGTPGIRKYLPEIKKLPDGQMQKMLQPLYDAAG